MELFSKKLILLAAALLLYCHFSLIAQNDVIKGLKLQLEKTVDERKQIDLFNKLSYEYYQINIDSTFSYGAKALAKAEKINYQKGKAEALRCLAIGQFVQKNTSKSIELNNAALKIARQIGDSLLIANILNSLGIRYEAIGFSQKAIACYLESLEYSLKNKDDKLLCFTYRNLGFLYEHLGNNQKSIEYFNKGAEVARNSNHHMIKYIADLTEGVVHKRAGQYEIALEYFFKSFNQCTNNFSKAVVLQEISSVYQAQQKWSKTEDYLNKAIAVIEQSGNKDQLEDVQLELAHVIFKQQDYQRCLNLLEEMVANEKEESGYSSNEKKLYQLLAETNTHLQDYEAASLYFQKLVMVQDSLYDGDKLDLVAELEDKYQIKEKERENAYLRAQQEQSDTLLAQKKWINLFVTLLAILLSIVLLLLYNAYHDKKQFNLKLQEQVNTQTQALQNANRQLKASNSELEKFAYIASHDLKEPLRNISSFSSLLERKLRPLQKIPQIDEYLCFIKSNVHQMNDLIINVLEYSKVGSKAANQFNETNLEELIGEVKQSIMVEMKEQNAAIEILSDSPSINTNSSQLFLVFKNLITNGIKYNESKSKKITVGYFDKGDLHQFFVKDNGIGIDAQYLEKIFEMFSRLHNRQEYQGTGLGLAICKKIINNLGGEIWCKSSEGGSVFYFTIPKRVKQHVV